MSSNSSLDRALVTGASKEIGRAIALVLTKKFDIAITDLPEASMPLEALKAQIDEEGRKSAITSDNSLVTIEEDCKSSLTASHRPIGSLHLLGRDEDERFENFFRTKRLVKDQLSKQLQGTGTYVIEVFSEIEDQSALTFVIVEEEGSGGGPLPGSLKSEIRGLTEAAGAPRNSACAVKTKEVKKPVNSTNGPLMGKVATGYIETTEDEIGRVIALVLAKNFDIAISDLPEASTPLEALKAQIEKEGWKFVIISDDSSGTLEEDFEYIETTEEEAEVVSYLTPKSGYRILGTVNSLTFSSF
ncbi:hypothetical protein C0992_008272, partial [Termitomyces sp. T32_za158]